MSGLSDALRKSNEAHLSARAVSRRAQQLGYTLNHDTAARYLRGDHGRPDEVTLEALAATFEMPLATLREAADLPHDATEPYRPPAEAARLSRRQRHAVDEIIRAMLETPRAARATRSADLPRAARRGDVEPEDDD